MLNRFGLVGFALDQIEDMHFQIGRAMTSNLEPDNGATIFRHACKMGLEGIVSKRKDSPYRSGRSPDWLKIKNLDAPGGEAGDGRGLGPMKHGCFSPEEAT
jgi:ATP-dependent DNA ligase